MNYQLREISRDDLLPINKWRNDKELVDFLGNNFLFITEEIDNQWFDNYLNNRNLAIRLAIIDLNNNSLIGTVQLTSIHQINRSAEFSIMIGNKNYWSKGAGSFATKEILLHGFQNINLNRIYLTVLEYNFRAVKMYEKLGFRKEGVHREAIFKNGIFNNLVQMSILNKEFNLKNN